MRLRTRQRAFALRMSNFRAVIRPLADLPWIRYTVYPQSAISIRRAIFPQLDKAGSGAQICCNWRLAESALLGDSAIQPGTETQQHCPPFTESHFQFHENWCWSFEVIGRLGSTEGIKLEKVMDYDNEDGPWNKRESVTSLHNEISHCLNHAEKVHDIQLAHESLSKEDGGSHLWKPRDWISNISIPKTQGVKITVWAIVKFMHWTSHLDHRWRPSWSPLSDNSVESNRWNGQTCEAVHSLIEWYANQLRKHLKCCYPMFQQNTGGERCT